MSEQAPNNSNGGNTNNNQPRRNNNRRRHNNNRPRDNAQNNNGERTENNNRAPRPQGQNQNAQGQHPRPQGQNNNQNPNQRRKPQHNNNRPRPQGQNQNTPREPGGPFNIERIYEKYLNLLDQHIIARRKYHDLFYRADPAQKNKLERNFYNTLNDIREFESKLAPDVKALFEKRNNGYQYDRTYTSNHEISIEGDTVPSDLPPAEPHYLQSQRAADYSDDTEESVGTAEDYLKYKNF